jgi:hypothetical protein
LHFFRPWLIFKLKRQGGKNMPRDPAVFNFFIDHRRPSAPGPVPPPNPNARNWKNLSSAPVSPAGTKNAPEFHQMKFSRQVARRTMNHFSTVAAGKNILKDPPDRVESPVRNPRRTWG